MVLVDIGTPILFTTTKGKKLFKKIATAAAMVIGLGMASALPAQAATMPNLVGMEESAAYHWLDSKHIDYYVLSRDVQGPHCYVSEQGAVEPSWVGWLRFLGSLGPTDAIPVDTTLRITCVA